jgi:hypothetical protein
LKSVSKIIPKEVERHKMDRGSCSENETAPAAKNENPGPRWAKIED